MALLLVMGVIAILSFILFDFTFETKLNKLKLYNQEDRFQARLNAEAGLNLALAKLRLYREGRNYIEKNSSIQSSFSSSDLETVIIQPFALPITLSPKANIIQKTALQDFDKNVLIRGEMLVTITKISGLINPNSLRVIPPPTPPNNIGNQINQIGTVQNNINNAQNANGQQNPQGQNNTKNKWDSARTIIRDTLERIIDEKRTTDDNFQNKYANIKIDDLLNDLSYYVNDKDVSTGQDFADSKSRFAQKNITPKNGPMANLEELHLLPSWDDDLIDIVKNRMSVHELTSIPVNEITTEDLKIIFPTINNIQIEEFFKYRDGDPDKKIPPMKFKNSTDFESVVTSKLNIVSETDYKERIQELKTAGLTIDTAGKLYKVQSTGHYQNAKYTIVAIVELPIKENLPPPNSPPNGNNQNSNTMNNNQTGINPSNPNSNTNQTPKPIELLLPRVVEIRSE